MVYSRAYSPEVRVAVLELVEAEDNFLARSIFAQSLQSTDAAKVLVALSIGEVLDDFSLAPQVEALYDHHNPEVREQAQQVLVSLTTDYAAPDGSEPSRPAGQPTQRRRKERDNAGHR